MFRVIEPAEINFTVTAPFGEVRKKIVDTLAARGGRIKVDDDSIIVAGFGSNLKVRLLGAALTGIKSMPRDVLVQLKKDSEEIQISVRVRDTFGFGSRLGLSDKLQNLMYDDALSLKRAFLDSPIKP